MEPVKKSLEEIGFEVLVPTGYGEKAPAYRVRELSEYEFVKIKRALFKKDNENAEAMNELLVLNYDKPNQPNYFAPIIINGNLTKIPLD